MDIKLAQEFLRNGAWESTNCHRCKSSLERGGGFRPTYDNPAWAEVVGVGVGPVSAEEAARRENEVDLICHDCIYIHDAHEFRKTGILCGSSLSSTALIRQDIETYGPFFEAEVMMVPTMQAIWAKYKAHPTMNDPNNKRAILVNTRTSFVYERTWGEKFSVLLANHREMRPDDLVIEIFDSMCGYMGIEIYHFGRGNGMWIQGQVREEGADAWYRSCYADMRFLCSVNNALREFLGYPTGYTLEKYGVRLPQGFFGKLDCYGADDMKTAPQRAWKHAEDNVRAYLSRIYSLPEFQPSWIDGSGFWPMEKPDAARYRRIEKYNRTLHLMTARAHAHDRG